MSDAQRIFLNLVGAVVLVAGAIWAVQEVRTPPVEPPPAYAPVSAEVAEETARDLVRFVSTCELEVAVAMVDFDHLVRRALVGKRAPESFRAGFAQGVRDNSAFGDYCEQIKQGARLDFLHVRDGSSARAMLRFMSDDVVDYIELYVGADSSGMARVYDVHVYSSGTRFSEAIADLIETVVTDGEDGERLGAAMAEINSALEAGDGARANRAIRTLPKRIRRSRAGMVYQVAASQLQGSKELDRAVRRFRRDYGENPALDMILLDAHVDGGNYDDALADVERLDRAVGGDPWLRVARANVELERGNLDAAWTHVGAARRAAPELADVHWTALTIALARKDYPSALAIMGDLERDFAAEFDAAWMREHELYEGLLASEEWRAYQDAQQ